MDLVQYDKEGLNVSAGYNDSLPECLIALTIYVYPTPHMTFIGASPNVVRSLERDGSKVVTPQRNKRLPGLTPARSLRVRMQKRRMECPGRKLSMQLARTNRNCTFLSSGTPGLKYRATYPRHCAGQAQTAMHSFFSTWVGRAS